MISKKNLLLNAARYLALYVKKLEIEAQMKPIAEKLLQCEGMHHPVKGGTVSVSTTTETRPDPKDIKIAVIDQDAFWALGDNARAALMEVGVISIEQKMIKGKAASVSVKLDKEKGVSVAVKSKVAA